jgi:hypothetical protein
MHNIFPIKKKMNKNPKNYNKSPIGVHSKYLYYQKFNNRPAVTVYFFTLLFYR